MNDRGGAKHQAQRGTGRSPRLGENATDGKGASLMIVSQAGPVALFHFDPRTCGPRGWAEDAGIGTDGPLDERAAARVHGFVTYFQWAAKHFPSSWLLLPASTRGWFGDSIAQMKEARVLWYEDGSPPPVPQFGRAQRVWLLNGRCSPSMDEATTIAARRVRDGDLLVYRRRTAEEASYYEESLRVDSSGGVLGFRRHYDDAPQRTLRTAGEASLIVATGRDAQTLAAHVVTHGWGLDDVAALRGRFAIQWLDEPSEVSAFWDRLSSHSVRAQDELAPGFFRFVGSAELSNQVALRALLGESAEPATRNAPRRRDRLADEGWDVEPISLLRPVSGDVPAETTHAWHARAAGQTRYASWKRLIDVTVAGGGLVLLFPFLVLVAFLVRFTSRGPALFSHRRQGLGGKEFPCWKFRTMTVGAHHMQDKLRKLNEVDGPQFKIGDDPRLTRVGRWLRRLNVDEMPQLWNVLIGQMSLVGPRPSPHEENQLCPAWRRARLSVRPGLTGLWQVLRRRETADLDFQEWIYYDVEYTKHRSLWLDLQILRYTPVAMFASRRLSGFVARLARRGICPHASDMGWRNPGN